MTWLSALRMALKAISRNKLRAALTMLGIIIGVGSVIAMVAIAQGAKQAVQDRIARLGTNVLFVLAGSRTVGGVRAGSGAVTTLTAEDARAIERESPDVRLTSPGVRTTGQVVFGNQNWFTAVSGVGEKFLEIRDWPLASGRVFDERDVRGATKVAVLGQTVVEQLFGGVDPLDQTLRIKKVPFRVIGVLEKKGVSGIGQDQDDVVIIPYTTAQRRLIGITHIGAITLSARSQEAIPRAITQVRELLRTRHRLAPFQEDDFTLLNQAEFAETASEANRVMTLLLASIASVSLLVGGIGIMNIMLVSVTERTREIGVRMALGAFERDILFQFLIEAVALSVLGGLLGVGAGILGSQTVSALAGWPILISPEAVLLAFTFSALVGVFFGLYPATRAARLNPIEALRYE